MKQYLITFHPSLKEQEIKSLVEAIQLFKGVELVLPQGETSEASAPSGDFNIEPPPVDNFAPPSPLGTGISEPEPNHYTTQNVSNEAESQKKLISSAIKWGVHNKKVTLEQLQNTTPEGSIDLAKQLIQMMPQAEREKLLKE